MELTAWQEFLLTNLMRDRERLRVPSGAGRPLPRSMEDRRHQRQFQMARAGLIKMDLASWLGRPPTNADRSTASKVLTELEALGLIEAFCLRGSSYRTHIALTDAGAELAMELCTRPT